MKKAIVIVAVCALLFGALPPYLLGFSLWHLPAAMKVSAGMGAKLACSAKFVSGFDDEKIIADLASYSPANLLLELDYDLEAKRVEASFLNMEKSAATFREGLGCTLDIRSQPALDTIRITTNNPQVGGEWPKGNIVNTINPALQQTLDALLSRDNTNGFDTRALVVVKEGKLIAESYAEGITPFTPLLGWSMGKSLTAIMLGRMEYLGMANLAQDHLFEPWRNDARNQITLTHLLNMSSGLDFEEFYQPGSDATRMLFYSHSASDIAMASEYKYAPGTHYSYSSGTSNLLQRWMHEKLGGTPQASVDFLYNDVLAPLSMHHTIFEPDPSGVLVGSSYLYASARDWARLGMLMAEGGEFEGERLLSTQWVNQAAKPNTSDNYKNYGYQFFLNQGDKHRWPTLPEEVFWMAGNRKQYVMIFPSQKMVIVRLGWTKGTYPMEENFAHIFNSTL